MFAHILNDIPMPKLKMVTSLKITNDDMQLRKVQDKESLQNKVLSYLGMAPSSSTLDDEQLPLFMGKESYDINLVLEFYKTPKDMSGMGILT